MNELPQPAPTPDPKPQGVLDQFIGLFTEPSVVFQRLRRTPTWVGPFILILAAGLFASLTWAAKVDMEAAAKRKFEVMEQAFHVTIPPEVMDKALDQAATQGHPYLTSSLGVLLGLPLSLLVLAAILFAFTRFGGEDEEVTFGHAWAAAIVQALTLVPIPLLAGIMCLLRKVGGAPSYANLAPSHLGFWMHPANPWLRGLLAVCEPFYLFSFVALYFATRHTLRLKTWAIAVVLALTAVFGLGGHFFAGIF